MIIFSETSFTENAVKPLALAMGSMSIGGFFIYKLHVLRQL
jgi:hypothetical protein